MAQLIDASGVIRFEGTLTNGGAIPPADQRVVFAEEVGPNGDTFAITGLPGHNGDGGNVIEIAGDHSTILGLIRVTGSTGNDGSYIVTAAAYDSGGDKTSLTLRGTLPDPTVDGDVELPAAYTAEVELGAGTAMEWFRIRNLAAWDAASEGAFLLGTAADPARFSRYGNLSGVKTVMDNADIGPGGESALAWGVDFVGEASLPVTSGVGITVENYPLFTAPITLLLTLQVFDDIGNSGSTEVVIHPHLWEASSGTVTRTPPAP